MLYYLISSSYGYQKTTLPMLLDSLPAQNKQTRIIVTICNSPTTEKRDVYLKNNIPIRCYYVEWNAWEFSSLIVAQTIMKKDEYGFLLHDTCKAGPRFHEIVSTFQPAGVDVVDVYNGYCNFGLYRGSYLESQCEFLKSCIGITKQDAIDLEFKLWEYAQTGKRFPPQTEDHVDYKRLPIEDVYKTGHPRLVEHYRNVDLYKFKANWSRKSIYDVGV